MLRRIMYVLTLILCFGVLVAGCSKSKTPNRQTESAGANSPDPMVAPQQSKPGYSQTLKLQDNPPAAKPK